MLGCMAVDKGSGVMTPREVAAVFRVDVKTVARWAQDGKIKFIPLPSGHRRYDRTYIEAMLREGK
jgi:excisionase family DNA binding protein